MGSLITVIIVIAVIVQVVRAINEQRASGAGGGDSKDSWWEEENPSSASPQSPANRPPAVPTAVPRPTPSPHVQEILRHLQQQAQRAAAPSPKPMAVVVPTPPPVAEAPARRYLEEGTSETELSHAAREATDRAVAEVYTKSVTAAFPMTREIKLRRHSGQRTTIRVLSRSRRNLRQAMLLGEVLGPPRAFDL